MKLKYKILFIFLFCIFFCIFLSNYSYGANVDKFNAWVEENSSELGEILEGYDYLILNKFYEHYVILYYTNASNNTFYFENLYDGSRCNVNSKSDLGTNYFNCYIFNSGNNDTFTLPTSLSTTMTQYSGSNNLINEVASSSLYSRVLYNSSDIYYGSSLSNLVVSSNPVLYSVTPSFITTQEELESGKFDTLKIDAGDLDYSDNLLKLNIYDVFDMSYESTELFVPYIRKTFFLSHESSYNYVYDLDIYYNIPQADLDVDFTPGKMYMFELCGYNTDEIYSSITFTVGELTDSEIIQNSQDITNSKLDEQIETSKGIWDTIKNILNFLNPFSEDFFAYKLIELLVEALKSLFIPGDNFFTDWLDDLNEYFGDAFGILYYPFEILVDFLNRVSEIEDNGTAQIITPEFKLMDTVLLKSFSYDLYDILETDTFKSMHTVYLYIVDIILWLGLVVLARNVLVTFIGGVYGEATEDYSSYQRYSKYRSNKERYDREHQK